MKGWIVTMGLNLLSAALNLVLFFFAHYKPSQQWIHWATLSLATTTFLVFLFVATHKKNYVRG